MCPKLDKRNKITFGQRPGRTTTHRRGRRFIWIWSVPYVSSLSQKNKTRASNDNSVLSSQPDGSRILSTTGEERDETKRTGRRLGRCADLRLSAPANSGVDDDGNAAAAAWVQWRVGTRGRDLALVMPRGHWLSSRSLPSTSLSNGGRATHNYLTNDEWGVVGGKERYKKKVDINKKYERERQPIVIERECAHGAWLNLPLRAERIHTRNTERSSFPLRKPVIDLIIV